MLWESKKAERKFDKIYLSIVNVTYLYSILYLIRKAEYFVQKGSTEFILYNTLTLQWRDSGIFIRE